MDVRIRGGPRIPEDREPHGATAAGVRGKEQIRGDGRELQTGQPPTSLPELSKARYEKAQQPSGERTVGNVRRSPGRVRYGTRSLTHRVSTGLHLPDLLLHLA